jgi:epidermal growth factor receptor substrate 15
MQAPTQEEITSSRKILIETDPDSHAVLTHDAAVSRLFPRLRLAQTSNPDGTSISALDTFETAWHVIDSLTTQRGFMGEKQVALLVRLMGYAQTGELIAGADLGDINNMLRKPGPSCRVYGWTIPEGKSFDKSPSPEEAMLADAIMIEGGKYQYGVLDGEAAREVFRRSGLDNRTLATIWELVDAECRGFLVEKGVLRMLRLISCAQRGLRLHARLYESREHRSEASSASMLRLTPL